MKFQYSLPEGLHGVIEAENETHALSVIFRNTGVKAESVKLVPLEAKPSDIPSPPPPPKQKIKPRFKATPVKGRFKLND